MSAPPSTPDPTAEPHRTLTLDQVDTVKHLHRRIRLRAEIVWRLLKSDRENSEENESVMDLVGDIWAATGDLETLFKACGPAPAVCR